MLLRLKLDGKLESSVRKFIEIADDDDVVAVQRIGAEVVRYSCYRISGVRVVLIS